MPYGHFKIASDTITVMSDAWNAVNFTGTIDGNGNMIYTEVPLFLTIAGSRENMPAITNYVTYPEQDSADRSRGCITNLQVDLSANIQSAIFGTVYNATFVDVSLTDGDLMPDDGNAASYEGYIAQHLLIAQLAIHIFTAVQLTFPLLWLMLKTLPAL